jgi:hypothetical protein
MDPTARLPRRSGAAGTFVMLLPCAVAAILMARNRVADASEPVVGDEAVAAHGEGRLVARGPADVSVATAYDRWLRRWALVAVGLVAALAALAPADHDLLHSFLP